MIQDDKIIPEPKSNPKLDLCPTIPKVYPNGFKATDLNPDKPGYLMNGTFAPGNKIQHGAPHSKKMSKIRAAIFDATTEEDAVDVWMKVVQRAKGGSYMHQKLFLEYAIGAPKQEVEMNVTNLDPVAIQQRIDIIFGLKKDE